MEKKRKSGTAYLMQLAGKYKLHLFVSALFGIASALCSFVPYVMVYRSILVLLDGEGNALRYGLIAAAAVAGKFLCSIVSGTFSHIGAFNTLYNVRTQISRHIAKVNLGFFTDHASGEIKKVIIEDVERIERFLAHQIPDVTSAICAPGDRIHLPAHDQCPHGFVLAGACGAGAYYSRCGNGRYRETDADLSSPAGKAEHGDHAVHQRDARNESLQYDR